MKIGIIGCGNMGGAILRGMIAQRLVSKKDIMVCDKDRKRIAFLGRSLQVRSSNSITELIKNCSVVILAVKPQDVWEVINHRGPLFTGKLVISICAGIKTENLQRHLGKVALMRVMPNLPAQISEGISAISAGKYASVKDKRLTKSILSCIGEVVEIKEQLMDAVTAISGSGPAYFFYLVEKLAQTASKLGIAQRLAQKLAVKTALGSAIMLAQLKEHPRVLRKRVSSKGGTTEAAFKVFQKKGLDKILTSAFMAAAKRAKQLCR